MGVGNYSVEASIVENGKLVKGTLTLFTDEYVFDNRRVSIDWEKVSVEQITVKVKTFLRTIERPAIVFFDGTNRSDQFILKPENKEVLLNKINEFNDLICNSRKKEDDKQQRLAEEQQTCEETRCKTEEEYRRKQEDEKQKKVEQEQQERDSLERKLAEKKIRIQREVENCKNKPEEITEINSLAKKASACFLDNPYRILGISCLATNEEANIVLDKLKKMARLKAIASYRSPFDLRGVEKPVRNLSVAQNALSLLKDDTHKLFWFAEADACVAWQSGKYRIELAKEGEEYGTYDLFLANYMYALLCDSDFNSPETWKRVFSFYCYICKQSDCSLIRSRFTEKELQSMNNVDLLNTFKSSIFKPLLMLCERDDLDAVIRLHKCIRGCDNKLLDTLSRSVLSKLVSWFTEKEAIMLSYLAKIDSEEYVSEEKGAEIRERGEKYCQVVEPVFEIVLRDFRGDAVRYDMVKESYRHTTYQLMYELNKCADKSSAIIFANKCFSYCKADDKKRIQNTFGEVNIKSIDWNIPHTGWDVKGDAFYYGRGCSIDYTQALYWYHKAADAGNMYSQNSLGICYQKGNGVPQNDVQAASWFEKAAQSGNPEGAYNLAECYFTGTGVKRDIDMALKYWDKAAKLGHPSAAKRKSSVFSEIQFQRKKHRAHNHICHDIGFQMTSGVQLVVEVTLNHAANAYLVNAQGYQNYLNGNKFTHYGGFTNESPYRIRIPSSNHWYVIVDNGDEPITGIASSVKVKRV